MLILLGQVSYIANRTSDPGTAAANYFSTYYSAPGTAPPVGDGWHPKQKSYGQWDLLTDHDSYFMSSFIPQFNWFLSRGYQACHTGQGCHKMFNVHLTQCFRRVLTTGG